MDFLWESQDNNNNNNNNNDDGEEEEDYAIDYGNLSPRDRVMPVSGARHLHEPLLLSGRARQHAMQRQQQGRWRSKVFAPRMIAGNPSGLEDEGEPEEWLTVTDVDNIIHGRAQIASKSQRRGVQTSYSVNAMEPNRTVSERSAVENNTPGWLLDMETYNEQAIAAIGDMLHTAQGSNSEH